MILVRHAKGRRAQTGSRNPGNASDPRGAERARWRKPRGCGTDITGHPPRDVSVAGAVPSRWVERAEGEAPGGASAEIERRHAEMALQYDNPEEPAATPISVRTMDPGDGSGADQQRIWHSIRQDRGGPTAGAARHYTAKAAVPGVGAR